MEIDLGLKQETPPLTQALPGPDNSEPGSGTSQGTGVVQSADREEMDISTLPSPEGDDALTLLPEVQATGRPVGSRRPFQRRRRSRACDACRARKTKVSVGNICSWEYILMDRHSAILLIMDHVRHVCPPVWCVNSLEAKIEGEQDQRGRLRDILGFSSS